MANPILPRAQSAVSSGDGVATREWYSFFQQLLLAANGNAPLEASIQSILVRVAALEADDATFDFTLLGIGSVLVQGTPQNGVVVVTLDGDENDPGIRYRYGTDEAGTKGWARLFDDFAAGVGLLKTDSGYVVLGEVDTSGDLPPTGNVGEAYRVLDPDEFGLWAWEGAAWLLDAAADGVIGFQLDGLPNSGIGASPIKLYTRDAYGRIEGDQDADTDDLPEGAANLYFTDERAQDAVGTLLVDSADIDFTYNDATPSIAGVLTTAIHDSLELADTAVQSVVAGTNVTVNNTDPRNPVVSASGGGGGVTDGDKGDITVTASGATWTIDPTAVTLAKMADVASGSVFYRKTASSGAPEVQPLATLKTDLGLTGTNSGDQTSIVGVTGTLAEFNAALTGADFSTGGGTATGTNTGDQTLSGLGGQPLDATLTALAGANWADNALPIGTGADTLSQTTFAANTFPSRASTGNLVAKPLTDFALTLLDDSDATTARTTLGAGTVTSVAVANATGITWAGSPITAGGTLTPTLSPNLQAWSGLATSAKEDAFSKGTLIQGSGVTLTGTLTNRLVGSGDVTVAATGGGSGTVTSVGLSLPAIFDVTGSPVTTSGTLLGSFLSQAANQVLASPDGGPGTPAFRALTVLDGATGFTAYALGDLLVGESSGALTRFALGDAFDSLTISTSGTLGWDKIDLTNGVTAKLLGTNIADDAVTNTILRNSAALSVIGRSANSTGDPGDIAAGSDGFVLRRSGTALGFGTVATAGITNAAITNAKLANMVTQTFKGRTTAGTGVPEDLTLAQVRTLLNLTDSGWTAPTLGSSWVNYGGAYIVAGYRKIGSDVTLRGIIKSGTTTDGTTLFTLPADFRPTATRWFLCGGGSDVDGEGSYNVQVTSGGAVQIFNLTLNGFVSLDGVSFHIN